MRSPILRILIGVMVMWPLLTGLDLHSVMKIGVQVAHVEHHIIDHEESIIDFMKCLVHADSEDDSQSDSDHQRHHEPLSPAHSNTCSSVQMAVPTSIIVVQPHSGDLTKQTFFESATSYAQRPLSSIFQPPRA